MISYLKASKPAQRAPHVASRLACRYTRRMSLKARKPARRLTPLYAPSHGGTSLHAPHVTMPLDGAPHAAMPQDGRYTRRYAATRPLDGTLDGALHDGESAPAN